MWDSTVRKWSRCLTLFFGIERASMHSKPVDNCGGATGHGRWRREGRNVRCLQSRALARRRTHLSAVGTRKSVRQISSAIFIMVYDENDSERVGSIGHDDRERLPRLTIL